MRAFDSSLPIDAVLDDLLTRLETQTTAVLVAPPGAGKTTRVPLALLDAPWAVDRKIIVLEPRRIAVRASAERMAKTLSENVGATVGTRVRFDSKISRRTRIEVVTEGIFTRQILDNPELSRIAAVLFDEFHERSLDTDLGLALARDVQQGLREDLRILVMSATLDGARVADLLGKAPVIASEGRAFPVETRYLGRKADQSIERQIADAIMSALRTDTGSVLAFLPGAAEIRRTHSLLSERVHDASIDIVPLFGALEPRMQDHAIAPAPKGRRKVVLATSIAETSLTIEGVRIVIDSGLARVPRYEPDIGLTRLETIRASRAAVDQRRGRAGRIEPGVCYRLWDEPQTAFLDAYTRPEILSSDLSSLLLDLAQWGINNPSQLTFLDPPPAPALNEARVLLQELGALDDDGRITTEGHALRALTLPPRLARMIVDAHRLGAGEDAAYIAAVLTERGLGGDNVDLDARLDIFRRDRSPRGISAHQLVKRWASQIAISQPDGLAQDSLLSTGVMLAFAFPERVARNRGQGSFVLANGRGAAIDQTSALARSPYIVVAELTGTAAQGRILLAASITQTEIETHFAKHITTTDEIHFDRASMSLRARRRRKLQAIILSDQPLPITPSAETARMLADGLISVGLDQLPWSEPLQQWRSRIMFLRAMQPDQWPDLSDAALKACHDHWLVQALFDKTSLAQLSADHLSEVVRDLLPWDLRARLDREAPTHFEAPTGSMIPIDYRAEDGAKISVRLQELFGLTRHPTVAQDRVPLVVELLSPAHRPVQVTRDLPGFWRGSYTAVRADLRGRYPRHPWPDNPATATPTRRAKPRKT